MFLTVVLIVSVLLQLCASYLALRLIPVTRHSKVWSIVAAAITLMAFRRGMSLYALATSDLSHPPDPNAEFIALISSALLLAGVAAIRPIFQSLKRSEELVRQSEACYRNLYEAAPCGFFSLDRDGIILNCNHRAEQVLGYAHGVLIGIPMAGLLLDSNSENGRPTFALEHLWDGVPLADLEVRMCTADGHANWVSLSIQPIADAKDAVMEFRAIIVDITERKRSQEQLRLTQFVVDHASEAIHWVDEDARLIYVNDTACEQLGYTRDELLSMTIHDIDVNLRRDDWRQEWAKSSPGQLRVFESAHRRKNGQAYPIEVSVSTLTLDDHRINCAFIRDITERKRAEEALRESEDRHSSIFAALDEGVMLLSREGRVLAANPSCARLLGVDPEEIVNGEIPKSGWEYLHPDESPFETADLPSQISLLSGEPCTNVVVGMRGRGGETKWFSVNSQPAHHGGEKDPYATAVSFRDVTRQKVTEDALRESECRFRDMLAGVHLIAVTLDTQGDITFCNDYLLEATGWQRDEVIGKGWFDLFIPIDVRARINAPFRRDTPLGIAPAQHEYDILTRDGRRRLIHWSNTILRDPDGSVTGTASIGEDITERKRAETIEDARLRLMEFAVSHSLDEVMQKCLDEAEMLTGSTIGFYHLVDSDQKSLTLQAWSSNTLAGMCTVEGKSRHYSIDEAGVWRDCVRERRPVIHNDYDSLSHRKGMPPGHAKVIRELVIPIMRGDRVVAVMGVGNKPAYYTEEDVASLSRLADLSWDIAAQRRAEDELRMKEEEYRRLFEANPHPMLLGDRDTLTYIAVNDAALRQYGYTREEFLSLKMTDLRLPEDTPYFLKRMTGLKDGLNDAIAVRHRKRDGTVIDVETVSYTYTWQGRRVALVLVNDVTERKRAEEQIIILKHSLDAHRDGAYWLDSDNRFVYVNDAGCRALGYTQEELIGKSILDINPRASQEAMNRVWKILRTHGFFLAESVHRRRDGSEFPTEIMTTYVQHGGKEYAAGFARDITERKRAEDALKDALTRFEAVIEQTPLVAVQSLNREGEVQRWNPACATLYGYPAAGAIGRSLQDLIFSGHEAVDFEDTLRRVWDEGRPSLPRERASHASDGTARIIYSSMFPIRQDGKVAEVIRTDVDITDRKRTEDQLLRAKRLEAAGQIAGQIAHDFNNLLGPLIAYPELILPHLDGDPRVREMLHDMEEAAKQIAEINQELLTMSRRGHYNLEPVDLNRLIECGLRTLALPPKVTVHKELTERLPLVRGGPSQIMRSLANLITNALDAMPDGGALTIRTGNMRFDLPLEQYPDVKPGDFVRLDISDTGRGIPADAATRIFEPFFTTKKADKKRGSGLGLTVVHSVMQDHEGFVDFKSTSGEGTTFSLLFPVNLGAVPDSGPVTDIPRGNGELVLVADDDAMQLRIAERTLRQLGYTVHTVSSGEEAVAFLAGHPQDIVLLDMVMDGIDGTETLRRIKKIYPDQIALILSGFACSDRVDEALRLGAKGFVQKPVQIARLAAVIHKALSARRAVVSAAPVA